ncbi:hypothetical protein [Vibrio sp. DNB22_19_2]
MKTKLTIGLLLAAICGGVSASETQRIAVMCKDRAGFKEMNHVGYARIKPLIEKIGSATYVSNVYHFNNGVKIELHGDGSGHVRVPNLDLSVELFKCSVAIVD